MSDISNNEVNEVVSELLSDYKNQRAIDNMDIFNLPNKEQIVSITEKLMRLIFPGYYWDKNLKFYNIDNNITSLIEDVMYRLNRQIAVVLQNNSEHEFETEEELEEASKGIVLNFMRSLPAIRACLDTDLEAAYEGDPAAYSKHEIVFSYPGLYAIATYRLAHELCRLGVPMIPRIMTEHAHSKTGVDIHPGATIGKYFFIDHGTGIVIGETTIIGDHVKVYQGVTLGGLSTRGGQQLKSIKRHPTIKDNVTIYSGASILGGETVIGENVVIGGNAFITKSVKANTRVSVKNQELMFNNGSEVKETLEDDGSW